MEALVFKPRPDAIRFQRLFGGFFVVIGAIVGLAFVVFGTLFVLLFGAAGQTPLPSLLLMSLLPVCGGGMGVVFVAVGLLIALSGTNQEVQITLDALLHRRGKKIVAMPYEAVARVYAQWRSGQKSGHWAMIVEDAAGVQIELGIGRRGYLALFDVLPVVRELLPRLSSRTEIDPRIREYADTGQMHY